jgi:hypothetical protein
MSDFILHAVQHRCRWIRHVRISQPTRGWNARRALLGVFVAILASGALTACADYEAGEVEYVGIEERTVGACVQLSIQSEFGRLDGSKASNIHATNVSGPSENTVNLKVTGETKVRLDDGSGQINYWTCETTTVYTQGKMNVSLSIDRVERITKEGFKF